jgi:hypothetical protein
MMEYAGTDYTGKGSGRSSATVIAIVLILVTSAAVAFFLYGG